MTHQTAAVGDTVYFWFASNDTSGSGGDGSTPLYDVREAGASAGAAPLLSGTPTLLSHANYPAGCHEIAVAATVGNGFAADDTFSVFCTLAIDSQNPSGFVGSCTLTPLAKASGVSLANGAITNASLAGNMEIVFETDFATNYNTTRNAWVTNYTDVIGTGGWNVGKTGYSLTATTGLGNQTSNITGNLSGSVGSVTGAAGSVTGAVGSVAGNVDGNVTGSVGSNLELGPSEVNAQCDIAISDADIATETKQDVINTNVDSILADTNELQTDNVPGLIAALNDAPAVSVSDILTTQMTEAYAADGTAPTLAQALFLIQQTIGDFSISGTTLTANQLDGSTAAATYLLDDDTAPTSRTRVT